MKRLLVLIASLALTVTVQAATIINPLPNNIQNGQPADANKLMANFNQIVSNTNNNAAALSAANVFSAQQQFAPATTLNQGVIASQLQNESVIWLGTLGGTASAVTGSSAITQNSYAAGQRWKGVAAYTGTGPTTININGLGPRNITKVGGNALVAGDIVAGQLLVLNDDGVRLQLLNPATYGGLPYADAAGTSDAITATYTQPSSNFTITDGLDLLFDVTAVNATTTPTFTPTLNGVLAPTWTIVKFVANSEVAVTAGDVQGIAHVKADVPNSKWVLMSPAQWPSASTVTTTIASGVAASTQTLGNNSTQVATTAYVDGSIGAGHGTLLITGSGTWTVPATVTQFVIVDAAGAGGGGTGGQTGTSGGGGGGAGQKLAGPISVTTTPGTVYTATLGSGGNGGNGLGVGCSTGSTGGTTAFSGSGLTFPTLGGGIGALSCSAVGGIGGGGHSFLNGEAGVTGGSLAGGIGGGNGGGNGGGSGPGSAAIAHSGGGGGGGGANGAGYAGAAGASGYILIVY